MADVSNLPDLGFSRANDPKKSTTTKSSASSPALVGNLLVLFKRSSRLSLCVSGVVGKYPHFYPVIRVFLRWVFGGESGISCTLPELLFNIARARIVW